MIGHDSRYESARIRFAIARLPAFFASEPARLPASPHGIARGSPVVIVPAVRELLSGAETAGSGLQKPLRSGSTVVVGSQSRARDRSEQGKPENNLRRSKYCHRLFQLKQIGTSYPAGTLSTHPLIILRGEMRMFPYFSGFSVLNIITCATGWIP